MNKIIKSLPLIIACIAANTSAGGTQSIDQLQKRIEQLESKDAESKFDNTSVSLYGTFRPTLAYTNQNDDSWDVRDALSHFGVSAETELSNGWTAIAKGEWSVDLSNNGNLGKARQVYLGLATPFGQIALGKQRPTQYTLIAEYLDVFNHAASPFAFDSNGPFFVNNLVTYKHKISNMTIMAVAQVNGDNDSHFYNSGIAYDTESFHIGIGHVDQSTSDTYGNHAVNGDKETLAATLAYTLPNDIYLAASYADVQSSFTTAAANTDGSTIDTALVIPLGGKFRAKLGYFDYDDGKDLLSSAKYDGFNATLEWNPAKNTRMHLEYVQKNTMTEDYGTLTVGIRYDFKLNWGS